MDDDRFNEEESLIVRYLTRETNADEEKALQHWRSLSADNEALFVKIEKVFKLTGKYDPHSWRNLDIDVDSEWRKFDENVKSNGNARSISTPETSGFSVWKIAAVVLLIISAGWVINFLMQQNQEIIFKTTAEQKVIVLPDGTKVSLNRNSMLSYDQSYGDELRNVTLTGEAFFEVVPNANKRFEISVDGATVTVLGTSFNVFSDNEGVEVVVATGVVQLSPQENGNGLELVAGDKGVFDATRSTVEKLPNDDLNFQAWKTKRIVFEGQKLKSVVEILSRVYGVDFVLPNDISADCEVTVTFDNQSLEAVLAVLESTLDLVYKRDGNKIEIIKAGC